MDTTAILLIAVPVLVPALTALGVDLVQFGLVMVVNLLIGTLTPPFGILLFVMTEVAQVRFRPLLKATLPFYPPLVLFLLLLTYWPGLSLWLPGLLLPGP